MAEQDGDYPPIDESKRAWEKASIIITALATMVIAAATVATVLVTVHHAEIFSEQLGTMRGQASVMQGQLDQMKLAQRAWIGIETIDAVPAFPEIGKSFGAKGMIRNTGKTPALNLIIYSIIEPVLSGDRPNFSYVGIKSFSGGMLPPDGKGILPFNPLTDVKLKQAALFTKEQLEALNNETFSIYTHGRVEYDDIFGYPHWMTYCSYLSVSFSGFAFCNEHNDTDDNQNNTK